LDTIIDSIDSFFFFFRLTVLVLIKVFFKQHELANQKMLEASLLCTLFFTSGCASTLMREAVKANGGRMDATYPSVRLAGDSLKHPDMLTPLILLDLPLSAALDTVKLPLDASNAKRAKRGKSKVAAPLTKEQSAKRIERGIRGKLKKFTGELTKADLATISTRILHGSQLTSVKGLEKLPKLTFLDFSKNKLTDVKGVEKLTQLTTLLLIQNNLTSVKGLGKLTQLKVLNLSKNKLTSVEGLEMPPHLSYLNLNNNQLTEVKGLEELTQLKTLQLNNNKLTEVPKGLQKLTLLKKLGLGSNLLTDVKSLENLTQLEWLSLYGNQLTDLKGLENLTQLESLVLEGNQLTSVEGLENLVQLRRLYLKDNPALTKAQIDELQKALPNCKIYR
tara:strand:- start:121 stop:1290 length:1170 start_codon:yes stop_codon:yes gene_type:complete